MQSMRKPLDVLQDSGATLAQVLKALAEIESGDQLSRTIKVGISSNATVDLLGTHLRRCAAIEGARLEIVHGEFDNFLGDIDEFSHRGIEYLVYAPVFDLLLPAFESQLRVASNDFIAEKRDDFRGQMALAFSRLTGFREVFVCTFHFLRDDILSASDARSSRVLEEFNDILTTTAAQYPNIKLIEMNDVVSAVGRVNAFDSRFYYRAKAPYSSVFLGRLAEQIVRVSRGFGQYFFKVLVLDCDNTLWGGVVGEDGLHGIHLHPHDYPGNVFWRAQQEFLALERSGVLLCLCSKNNPEDVNSVLDSHPHAVLRPSHIALMKVNWDDKVSNLRAIAKELNLGLDSFVFLDDSSFECESVRLQLPMVRTIQVPQKLSDYPRILEHLGSVFLAGNRESAKEGKTEQYRVRALAEEARLTFSTQEEYLASLDINVKVQRNENSSIARISELTKKSNQFNLTTRRYEEAEIAALMSSADATVYSLTVSDKFGSSGLTGIVIVRWDGAMAEIDSFLMSCRIIGRGIERCIWPLVVRDARERNCTCLCAEFIPTAKNGQVSDFYDRIGFHRVQTTTDATRYRTDVETFQPATNDWITVDVC